MGCLSGKRSSARGDTNTLAIGKTFLRLTCSTKVPYTSWRPRPILAPRHQKRPDQHEDHI